MLKDVICENSSSGGSESIKSIFTVSGYLKKPLSVLKIVFQIGMYNMTTGEGIKNELKVAIRFGFFKKKDQVMIRYHTP